jgi:hypothetical protein
MRGMLPSVSNSWAFISFECRPSGLRNMIDIASKNRRRTQAGKVHICCLRSSEAVYVLASAVRRLQAMFWRRWNLRSGADISGKPGKRAGISLMIFRVFIYQHMALRSLCASRIPAEVFIVQNICLHFAFEERRPSLLADTTKRMFKEEYLAAGLSFLRFKKLLGCGRSQDGSQISRDLGRAFKSRANFR